MMTTILLIGSPGSFTVVAETFPVQRNLCLPECHIMSEDGFSPPPFCCFRLVTQVMNQRCDLRVERGLTVLCALVTDTCLELHL